MPFGPSRPGASTGRPRPSRSVTPAARHLRWFVGGTTNLATTQWTGIEDCPAAHRTERADLVLTETNQERIYSFAELQAEVECMAAILREQGVARGDRSDHACR